MTKQLFLFLIIFSFACTSNTKEANTAKTSNKQDEYLIKIEAENSGQQGYINTKGDTLITLGKYDYCFTDTFRTFAIVASTDGLIGINRKEETLFKVMMYDNGPDYIADGLFRIEEGDQIGYANTKGEVVIQPKFTCAYPFENGKAKVATNCKKIYEGEHAFWESEEWFWIDKTGKKIE